MKIKEPSLVQVTTSDNLYLQGYFAPQKGKTALLHIHGFEGNFYENKFVQLLAEKTNDEKITFLTVNTRGNGKDTNFNTTDGGIRRVGSYYEVLEEAQLDIDAWIEFLVEQGYEEIILSGHSLGTYKVTRYLFEGKHKDKIKKLLLLAPFDGIAELYIQMPNKWKDYLIEAERQTKDGNGELLIPNTWSHTIVLSYQTFASWYKQDDFGRVFEFNNKDYNFPLLKMIIVPTKIIVGSKDEFFHLSNPNHSEEAMDILLKNIPNSEGKIIDGAVHSYSPHEDEMVEEVIKFIKK